MADLWSIIETSFDPARARAYEGLFTTGSGYLHLRGSLEEHLLDAPQNLDYTRRPANVTAEKFSETSARWGSFLPGIRGCHPLLNRGLVNLPFFLDLAPYVGSEKLDMLASNIKNYRRTLDLKTATLHRSLTWHTRLGPTLAVAFERFVSAGRPQLSVQQMRISTNQDIRLTVQAGIDSDVRTSGMDMFTKVQFAQVGQAGIRCSVETNTGDQAGLLAHLVAPQAEWEYSALGRTARLAAEFFIPAGSSLRVEKRTVVTSSFDRLLVDPAAILAAAAALTFSELHAEHAAAWEQLWDRADVVIEGDEQSQLALRTSLYHLLRAHPRDNRLAIDPKGYAGDAYRGCYFWDTEMYLLPFFLYTDPPLARSLLEYRIGSLPGARANALHTGYNGARYAWEADIDGTETCPNWQYRDHEVHVTADIVYAMVHFARATEAAGFLTGPAAPVILETARFWLDRLDWRLGEDHPSLLGVMGPDEYTPISNNNSYTNRMAAFVLAQAAQLGQSIGAVPDEIHKFTAAAAGLPIPRSQDGRLVLQCEDFERLAEPAFERFWLDRTRPFASQVSQEWLYRSKCLKQADVLLLMMLFAHEFSDEEVRAAWDYYLPYTTHDSSLSAGVHSVVAARLGKAEEAWSFWQRSSLNDLDIDHGGAAEGVHIAGAGMNWQMAVFGFAGVVTAMNTETLTLHPRLPPGWSRLAFPLVWKGCRMYLDIQSEQVIVHNRGARSLAVDVKGCCQVVAPQQQVVFA